MSDGIRRPDVILAAVAVPLVLAGVAALVLSVPLSHALGVGAIPSGGSLGYALFRSPTARP